MTYSARDHKAKPAAQAARSAARIGAAQALYQMDLAGADVSDVIHEFTTLRFPNSEAGETIAGADPTFFAELLRGVVRRQRDLDPMIDEQLASGWRLQRIDSILRWSSAWMFQHEWSSTSTSTSLTPFLTKTNPRSSMAFSTGSPIGFVQPNLKTARARLRGTKKTESRDV